MAISRWRRGGVTRALLVLFVASELLSLGPATYFVQPNPSDYALFGIHYLVLPQGMPSPVPAQLIMVRGDYALWVIKADSYMDVVRVTGTLSANRTDVGRRSLGLLHGDLLSRNQDWVVSWPDQHVEK